MASFLDTAVSAARRAGLMLKSRALEVAEVKQATAHDIKLALDVAAQEMIFAEIAAAHPAHALLGEEGMGGAADSEFQWIVDPLDGTVNYFYGIPHWCVSVALRRDRDVIAGAIFDPNLDELFTWEEGGGAPRCNGRPLRVSARATLGEAVVIVGLSRTNEAKRDAMPLMLDMIDRARKCRFLGSAALAMAWTAAGRIDAYLEPGISLWDIAAGWPMVEHAGGTVRLTPRGRPGGEHYSIAAVSGSLPELAGARWEGSKLLL